MKRIISSIGGVILGFGVIAALSAEEVKTFEELDADSDGYISKEEAKADQSINNNWTKADKDSNGHLDISEFSAFEATGYVPPHDREEPEPGAAPLN